MREKLKVFWEYIVGFIIFIFFFKNLLFGVVILMGSSLLSDEDK